ncbi:MAG: SHOCT domain-containing protein [Gemmatimonadaceae bacterium]
MMMMLQQAASTQGSWHRQGMFFGMHWVWWGIWIATVVVLLWAIWRMHSDRVEAHRDAVRRLSVEEVLRHRFASGEISEEEYAARLRVLAQDAHIREVNPEVVQQNADE